MDTNLGLEVVVANGFSIHVTADDFPDLWYALRDARDFFGTITLYLDTVPAPSSTINFEYIIPGLYTSGIDMTELFILIQVFALNSSIIDSKIGFGVHLDDSTFTISGTHLRDLTFFQNILGPALLSGLLGSDLSTIGENPWLDLLDLLAVTHLSTNQLKPYTIISTPNPSSSPPPRP